LEPENKELSAAPCANTHAPRQDVKCEVFELVKMVCIFLILFWGLKSFVIEGYEVQGPSMTPTLEDRERILVFKLSHQMRQFGLFNGMRSVKAGDIVVFDSDELNKRYVKRVIALGPPTPRGNKVGAESLDAFAPENQRVRVEYRNGEIYINEERMEEGYLVPVERSSRDRVYRDVGPGQFFVLGDHRSVSKDSRRFGPIRKNQVVGKAVLRFWPLSKFSIL
jgi:signal peptidase I